MSAAPHILPPDVLVAQVVPARVNDPERPEASLETAMQSLVVHPRRALALEIAGDGTTGAKQFLVRATAHADLAHAQAQVQAYAPQLQIRPLASHADPLQLRAGETVSSCELRPGGASFLPLKEMGKTDPLRGVLAALSLPPGYRGLVQVTLVPAPSRWSHPYQRKAVEHALEPERRRERRALARVSAPSAAGLLWLLLLLSTFLLWGSAPLPPWVLVALSDLIGGHWPPLLPLHALLFYGGMASLFVSPLLMTLLVAGVRQRFFAPPLYDHLVVARKTGQMAYRVRLRLYVFGPGPARSLSRLTLRMVKITATLFWRGLRRGARRHGPRLGLRTWLRQRISVGRGRQGAKRALVQLRAGGQQSRQALQALLRQNGRTILRVVGRWCLRRIWVLLTGGLHLLWILGLLSIRRACALYCGGRKAARAFGQGVRAGRRALRRSWRPVRQEWSWRCQQRRARQEMVMRLVAAYRQFDTAGANYLVPRRLFDTTARRLVQGRWSRGVRQSRHFLTSDVLSRTWYLPQETALELPGLEQKRARTLLIPTCLIAPVGYRIVGTSIHAGYAHPFAYLPEFLRQHTLIAGKTGEGKSTVLVSIARAAMEAGEGVCLLDPHGDLALDCLLEVPPQRHDDVVYIDLGEKEFSIGLNPLDVTLGRERDLVVAALVGTFQHLWEDGWGTRMEAPFRAALMTLYEANVALVGEDRADEQYTLLDVFQLLLDEGFCQQLLERVQDFYLHRFWYTYFQTLDVRQWRERIDPVLTKMLQFEAYSARRILGQGRSTLNLNEMIAERKILIVRLAAGEVGLAAPLIGATFLGLLMVALREQGTRPVDERARMAIIIDEFQILAGADYSLLLAELRKFGAAATLGTQSFEYLNKLDPHLLPTALANVKQFLIFRTSAQDARLICREIDVDDADIVNQDSYSCYVRLIYQGVQQPTFSLRLAPPRQTPQPDTVERFRLHSQRYTRRAADIEETLKAALARTLGMGGETGPVALTRPARGNRSAAAPIIEGTVSTQSLPTHAAGAEQTPPPPAAATAPSTTPQQSAPASDPRTSTHFGKKPRHGPFGKKGDLSSFDVYPVCQECTSEKMSEREGDL